MNLATFTDPGGAEPNSFDSGPLANHYSATVNWGGSFGTSTATISFGGTPGSTTDSFTVMAMVPYVTVGTYTATITINHEGSTAQTVTDTVTINTALLTVTADADANAGNGQTAFTKTYGSTKTYAGIEFTTSGLVNGDTVTQRDIEQHW